MITWIVENLNYLFAQDIPSKSKCLRSISLFTLQHSPAPKAKIRTGPKRRDY